MRCDANRPPLRCPQKNSPPAPPKPWTRCTRCRRESEPPWSRINPRGHAGSALRSLGRDRTPCGSRTIATNF
ncbi:hypothetical protein Mp_2g04230 [Marchantia polymorpha subsp. ruderalis]|uniref:Uncharacterized protein n=1 Tax=Marchantia polymorpha TaxID=3197 RepID=A0A2R6X7M2_MARPO|nr:hypothetical protein MARPO_0031s0079 [Marchantia polymorpha]BBN01056.1 hypothetical protein Mp_2g04230 [Marchantia polymorpha subsp. ruderalis]|eukprot:PTQ42105.1 hypothetical protein MARPO_0031s0079 [Marchantia polymorpha]